MIVSTKRRTIGFDRKIQLDWLDATADWAAQGLSIADVRTRLEQLLEGKVAGDGPHSARGKTMTVLLHIWVRVPDTLVPLRDDGLTLLRDRSGQERLPLHWGMCVATYALFRDVAATTGRLLRLQGTAALSQITRRMTETWGDRSTIVRATQRVIRSMVLWEALRETQERGVFAAGPPIEISRGDKLGPWMIEAAIAGSDHEGRPLRSLLTSSFFFPFRLNISLRELALRHRLEVHRQGLDEDMVTLRR